MPRPRRSRWRLKRRFNRILKRVLRPALNRLLTRYSEVGDPVVFDPKLFPWTRLLEGHCDEIRQEALRLRELRDSLPTFHEVSPYQKRISQGDDWKTAWLYGFGHEARAAQQLCPATTRLVRQVPQLETALFSMLAPGTHIPAHRGVYKGLINYHLGLVVPREADKCRMQLGDAQLVWQSGQSLVFDDTNTHEVWNETDEERIVLFLQFRRPFREPGRLLSRVFLWGLKLTPYLRKPMQNARASDERLRRAALERGILSMDTGAHAA